MYLYIVTVVNTSAENSAAIMAANKSASPTVERVNFNYLLLRVTAVECALLCLQQVRRPVQHPSIFLFIFLIDW